MNLDKKIIVDESNSATLTQLAQGTGHWLGKVRDWVAFTDVTYCDHAPALVPLSTHAWLFCRLAAFFVDLLTLEHAVYAGRFLVVEAVHKPELSGVFAAESPGLTSELLCLLFVVSVSAVYLCHPAVQDV
jgi:hypothetical protein